MERKESARKNILMIGVMSGGEILGSVAKDICGTKRYYDLIMHNFKKKEEAEIVFGNKPRTALIKNNGIEAVYDDIPYALEMHEAQMYVYRKTRSERKAAISQTIYNAQLIDLDIYPKEKPELYKNKKINIKINRFLYYSPAEIKRGDIKELRGSRISGLIIGNGRVICLYNTMGKNIKYRKKVEATAQNYLSHKITSINYVEKIFFCENFKLATQVIKNNNIKEKLEQQRKATELITSDIDGYIVPNGKQGSVYLKMILCPEYAEKLKQAAIRQEKREVVNCLTLTLNMCRRIAAEQGEISLLCTDEQKEMLESMNENPGINICEVNKKDLEEAVDEYIKINGYK